MKGFFYRIFCGFFIGTSIVAPGVSGSVMAVMMGIYSELLEIVSNPFKNFKRNFFYLLPMGIGALFSVVLLVLGLSAVFEWYPVPAFLLFIGLIGGSLPTVWHEAASGGFKKRYILAVLIAFLIGATIGVMAPAESAEVTASGVNYLYYGFCGAVAGMVSMVPGMSVSMILMMLGVYMPFLDAARHLDIPTLLVVGVCFVIAMVLFSRFTKFIFKKYHNFAYFMVFGFMCGSVLSIVVRITRMVDVAKLSFGTWTAGFVALCIGIAISTLFQRLGKKLNTQ